ncbi:MAG: hypothetical protein LBK41_04820, partial [Clostridiales bacterium]|nr:hypothetical protein [Clostridiales bacterium]
MALLLTMVMTGSSFGAAEAFAAVSARDDDGTVVFAGGSYVMTIEKEGFRYGFITPDGETIVAAHGISGLRFGAAGKEPSDCVSAVFNGLTGGTASFTATNALGDTADVDIHFYDRHANIVVTPTREDTPAYAAETVYPASGANTYLSLAPSNISATTPSVRLLDKALPDDYVFEARLRFANQKPDTSSAGLGARYESKTNFETLLLGRYRSRLMRLQSGGNVTFSDGKYPEIVSGAWYGVKLIVQGRRVRAYIGGAKVADYIDESASGAQLTGGAALRAYQDTVGYDDIKIYNPNDPSQIYYQNDFEDTTAAAFRAEWPEKYNLSGTTDLAAVSLVSEDYADTPAGKAITADNRDKFTIDLRLAGGVTPMYGLGDYGALSDDGRQVRSSANVYGISDMAFGNAGGGQPQSGARFVSTFSIAPAPGFAQVVFEEGDKRVALTSEHTLLGAAKSAAADVCYFFGATRDIYADYRAARNERGYIDTKPNARMFGVGWEAYGSLGWNAYQSSIEDTVSAYLDAGYDIKWAVVGSGFWIGDRSGLQGTTTSFGMWDDEPSGTARSDGLPDPRFPDPGALKAFLNDNDIKMLLGLRVHLKLPAEFGGKRNAAVDGTFADTLLENGYYLRNDDGSVMLVAAAYPGTDGSAKTAYVDGSNPEAAEWYREMAALWGADGWKEDTMSYSGSSHLHTYNDGNYNRLYLDQIQDDGYLYITRNGAYALTGDILRINDSNYGTDNSLHSKSPDRMLLNTFAYAASGVSNVYPDIVGGSGGASYIGQEAYQKYVAREAQFVALCPSLALGINILNMSNQTYSRAAYDAVRWHSTYVPYIYDAALKSWETGYPYSHNPLHIAYPEDEYVHTMATTSKREFEWLLGESLLAAPLFGTDTNTADTRSVYLPEGRWIEYSTGAAYNVGPEGLLLENREHPYDEIPAFVGGKGVLVGEDMDNKGSYFAEVFPIAEQSIYDYTFLDGETQSTITNDVDGWSPDTLVITDVTAGEAVPFIYEDVTGAFKFDYAPGHDYLLTGGDGEITYTVSAELTKPANFVITDDFNDGDMEGWTQQTSGGSAGYTVTATAGSGYAVSYGTQAVQGDLILNGSEGFTDYSVEADITPAADIASGKTLGFTLRANGKVGYFVGYTQGSGWRILVRNASNQTVSNTLAAAEMTAGRTYHFKASVYGNVISLYVDGILVNQATDDTSQWSAGAASLYTNGARVTYDNIQVSNTIETLPAALSGVSHGTAKVRLTVGAYTYETTPDDRGAWSVSADKLYLGEQTVTVEGLDLAGGVRSVSEAALIVTAPSASATEYAVVVEPSENGTVTSDPRDVVGFGGSVTFTVTPDDGYKIASVTINGVKADVIDGRITVTDVYAPVTVSAAFAPVPRPLQRVFFEDFEDADGDGLHHYPETSAYKVIEHGGGHVYQGAGRTSSVTYQTWADTNLPDGDWALSSDMRMATRVGDGWAGGLTFLDDGTGDGYVWLRVNNGSASKPQSAQLLISKGGSWVGGGVLQEVTLSPAVPTGEGSVCALRVEYSALDQTIDCYVGETAVFDGFDISAYIADLGVGFGFRTYQATFYYDNVEVLGEPIAETLTGTAALSPDKPKIGHTVTAALTDTNNTGTLA